MARRRGVTPFKRARAIAFRKRPTASEALAWELLRNRRMLGLKLRRQHVIAGYVADFYCVEHRLVLEIDGDIHLNPEQSRLDEERSEHLRARGLVVLRIRNNQVDKRYLEQALNQRLRLPPLPLAGEGAGGEG